MVLLYGTFPGIYAIVAAGVNEAFGPLHYKANFGLLFTQSVAYCIIMLIMTKISVIQVILVKHGVNEIPSKLARSLTDLQNPIIFIFIRLLWDTLGCS